MKQARMPGFKKYSVVRLFGLISLLVIMLLPTKVFADDNAVLVEVTAIKNSLNNLCVLIEKYNNINDLKWQIEKNRKEQARAKEDLEDTKHIDPSVELSEDEIKEAEGYKAQIKELSSTEQELTIKLDNEEKEVESIIKDVKSSQQY